MICCNNYKILSFSGKRENKVDINLTFYGAHIQGVPQKHDRSWQFKKYILGSIFILTKKYILNLRLVYREAYVQTALSDE